MTASVSPEVIEKWRMEFELWFCGEDIKTILKKDGAGNYTYMAAYSAWKAFIAGRQSVVIELPAPILFDDDEVEPSYHYWPVQITAALREQGYRVEVKGD